MRVIDKDIYIEYRELLDAGVSESTLKKASYRKSSCWEMIKDPKDKRKVLVKYEAMKIKYKKMVLLYLETTEEDIFYTVFEQRFKSIKMFENREMRKVLSSVKIDDKHLSVRHIERAMKEQKVYDSVIALSNNNKKQLAGSVELFYTYLRKYLKSIEIEFKNNNSVRNRIMGYKKQGIKFLVPSKVGIKNNLKINEDISYWLCHTYSNPWQRVGSLADLHKKYQEEKQETWPSLSLRAIQRHMALEDVVQKWYVARYGLRAWELKYNPTVKLIDASCRDALWVIDGTKLNLYYQDETGKIKADKTISLVVDSYSEKIVGWAIADVEDRALTFAAIYDAAKKEMVRPYQLLYDNQSGIKSKDIQTWLNNFVKVHFATGPYQPQAKPVEHIIGRFQKQVMKKRWYFTGQNITARSIESRANIEFIKENKDKLPREDQLSEIVGQLVEEWNSAVHHRYNLSRKEIYENSHNEEAGIITPLDMVHMFWLRSSETVTYRKEGVRFQRNGKKYEYEVYTPDGSLDYDFLSHNIGKKFYVSYAPDAMNSVFLVEKTGKDYRIKIEAQLKKQYHRAMQDMDKSELSAIHRHINERKAYKEMSRNALKHQEETLLNARNGHITTKKEAGEIDVAAYLRETM